MTEHDIEALRRVFDEAYRSAYDESYESGDEHEEADGYGRDTGVFAVARAVAEALKGEK